MNKQELSDRYYAQYQPLLAEFITQIEGINYGGMPQPHLPVIGSEYYRAKYKIAFYGMETNGWDDLSNFVSVAKRNEYEALDLGNFALNDLECLGWINNFHTSFWDFIFEFLARFYHVSSNDIRHGKCPEIVKSIIWGNTNSIERYQIQSKRNGVSEEAYNKVKQASEKFDNAEHIIKSADPKIIFVLNWNEGEKWLYDKENKSNVLKLEINDHFYYYYIRSSKTHVFWTTHPRWISLNIGFPGQIDLLIDRIKNFNVWQQLPQSVDDIWNNEESTETVPKQDYIANLAETLVKDGCYMSGRELAENLNRNNYGHYEPGRRGIFTLVRSIWHHFQEKGDYQTAYNIAMAFVKDNGDYAF